MTRREKPIGYLTPDSTPDERLCRSFSIPDSPEWLGNFMGAIYPLTQEESWQKHGTLTPAESAAIAQVFFDDAFYGQGACNVVDAPYWDDDDAEDADDEEPNDDEDWFGQIVAAEEGYTWKERIEDWVIAAFVGYAATPFAAIQFLTIAPRFRLAFKKLDIGGIVRVFIDAAEVGQVDTYSPTGGIANYDVVLPAPTGFSLLADEPHTLWVVMSDEVNPAVIGDPQIAVIKKRLWAGEIVPESIIYDPETDTFMRDWGDGAGFVDYPQGDPRNSSAFERPARTGSDPQCDTSVNSVQWLKDLIAEIVRVLDIGSVILALISTITRFLELLAQEYVVLIDAIATAGSTLFGLGSIVIDAAMTDETYSLVQCILYCNMDADGSISDEQYSRILNKVNLELNPSAKIIVGVIFQLQGRIGLENAGRIGEETGECIDCECGWCYTFDFTSTDGGFAAIPISGNTYGHWVDGVGWVSDAPTGSGEALYIHLVGFETTITSFESHTFYDFTCGNGLGAGNYADVRLLGAIQHAVNDEFTSPGGDHEISFDGSYNIDEILFNPSGTLSPCTITITSLTLRGIGDNPFGDDNC